MTTKKLTMPQIRAANLSMGHHTFDRKTMRFFGETMRNWVAGAVTADGLQHAYRNGGKAGNGAFLFDPKDGSMKKEGVLK